MPVVKLSIERIENLLGRRLELKDLEKYLLRLKSESSIEDGYVNVEINSDRPDLLISEGIVRALKGILEMELGIPRYSYESYESVRLRVERVDSRPFILMAVVRDLEPGEEFLRELIQFQEKLHTTLGRNRWKAAIGIHDLSKLPSGDCVYRYVSLETPMKPLHIDRSMSVEEVLKETDQGRSYGGIALRNGMHPAIICGDEIISLPPVINSDITRLEPDTRDLLIDVTGTDLAIVEKILEILTTTLAENSRRRYIGRIYISSEWGGGYYPRGVLESMKLEREYIEHVTGLKLSSSEIVRELLKARFNVEVLSDDLFLVTIPSYRADILHKIDLVEEILLSHGLENIEPEYIHSFGRGSLRRESLLIRRIRDIMTGLGFTEVMGYILGSKDLYDLIGLSDYIEVSNPVSREFSVVRSSMIPSMLAILSYVQNESKPIKIYEINEFVVRDPQSYTGVRTRLGISIAVMDHEISFEDIHSVVVSLLRYLGLKPKISRESRNLLISKDLGLLIEGRRGVISLEGFEIGVLGEVDPEILERLKIRYPAAVSSIDLDMLLAFLYSRES